MKGRGAAFALAALALALTPAVATAQDAAAEPAAIPEPSTAHAEAPEPPPLDARLPAPAPLTDEQEARARTLEGDLRCPVCRSQSIRQSRSFMAEDMRRRIRVMIGEGRTDEEIREYFVSRYGTWVLLTPPKAGFNLAAYLLPAFVVVIGAAGLLYATRRWSRAPKAPERAAPPPDSPELARLEQELEEIER